MRMNHGTARYRAGQAIPGLIAALLLTACGDPAPGEGVSNPPVKGPMPEVVSASEAIHSPAIADIDPGTLQEAEIEQVVPPGPRCSFAYTAEGLPVLAASPAAGADTVQGVIKIHGRLVKVEAQEATDFEALVDGATFTADVIRIEVTPLEDEDVQETRANAQSRPADLHFELEQGLRVNYRGWYTCNA